MTIEIIQGECLEVMKTFEDNQFDLVLTDPPYGTTKCKWDSVIPLNPMWEQVKRVTKLNSAIVMTASQPFSSVLVTSNLEMFKHEWVWIKNRGSNFANTVREPMKEHEVVLVFSRGGWTYNKQMQPRAASGASRANYDVGYNDQNREAYRKFEGREKHRIPEMRVPSSWQKFNIASGKEKTKHPTQKPIALMRYLLETYTNKGDMVLDFTMGSGTTGVACVLTNRSFTGIEISEEYCKIARRRVAAETEKMALFAGAE